MIMIKLFFKSFLLIPNKIMTNIIFTHLYCNHHIKLSIYVSNIQQHLFIMQKTNHSTLPDVHPYKRKKITNYVYKYSRVIFILID